MDRQKVALVTGAGGGMGVPTVRRLVSDGFRVAAVDINTAGVDAVIKAEGLDAKSYRLDATSEEQCRQTVQKVKNDFGRIDVFVNLIGWTASSRFVEENSDYWQKLIKLNFLPVVILSHAIAPIMIEQGGGKMLFVTSDAGKVGTSGEAVYAGLKGGVIAFAKSVAREWARYKINVNCTAPGPTDTPLEADQDPELVARRLKVIPFRRMARPEEQAAAIAFFVSDDADYITGQVLSISGGLTMQ
ncbi:MAG: SDR family oxidoreductase [Dongiaceae bacterium]